MKQHLALLATMEQISPILALRTIFPWEVAALEVDDGTTVTEVDNNSRRLDDSQGVPLLTACHFSEDLMITVHDHLVAQPDHHLHRALLAVGITKDSTRLGAEVFYDRVLTIDAAWCLLRNLRSVPENIRLDAAERVVSVAAEWHVLRMASFENRSSTSQDRRVDDLKQLVRDPKWLMSGVTEVNLNEEPRGSALSLVLSNRSWPAEVPVMTFNWPCEVSIQSSQAASKGQRARKVMGVETTAAMLPQATKISEEVMAVLNGAVISGHEVRVVERLDPNLYKQVNAVLTELGGKWSSGKQAHVFRECPKAGIAAALASGKILTERDFEFFPTPPELVAQLLLLTGLRPGMKVLEPSAGSGAIALSAAEVVGMNNVTCHELMPRNVKHLQKLGFSVDEGKDFLQVLPTPEFDRVLLNPPFSQGKDMAHIEHALKFLKPGGRLGAIASTSWQTAKNAKSSAFRDWVVKHAVTVQQIDRGAFKASGTDVPTVMLVLQASGQPTDQVATSSAVAQDNVIMDELAAAFA